MGNFSCVVFDFETTGLAPGHGDRGIEIGAVLLEDHRVTDRFQSLMNPGFRINSFIESFTGITNRMLESAPPCEEVMEAFAAFMGDYPLAAHNASFDRKFLESELGCINRSMNNEMVCSMLTARRVFPDAPNHKLGTLVDYCGILTGGVFHRALADAEMTGKLMVAMINEIRDRFGVRDVTFELLRQISRTPKARVGELLRK